MDDLDDNIVRFKDMARENFGLGESKRSGHYPPWIVRLEKGGDAFGDGVCCPGAMISPGGHRLKVEERRRVPRRRGFVS